MFSMKLTPRQRDVAELVARGKSNKQIGAELGLTEGTIQDYVHTLFQRVHVSSRVELALWWVRETQAIFAQEV